MQPNATQRSAMRTLTPTLPFHSIIMPPKQHAMQEARLTWPQLEDALVRGFVPQLTAVIRKQQRRSGDAGAITSKAVSAAERGGGGGGGAGRGERGSTLRMRQVHVHVQVQVQHACMLQEQQRAGCNTSHGTCDIHTAAATALHTTLQQTQQPQARQQAAAREPCVAAP